MIALRGLAILLPWRASGQALAHALGLPFAGPVVGRWLLLQHRWLFFVPVPVPVGAGAGAGVITHLDLVARYGLRLPVAIVVSSRLGLAVTALLLRALLCP